MNKEITVKSEKIFEGRILNLRVDTVELENQKYAKREIVENKNASCVLAITDDEEIVLVKQYRKSVEDFLYEVPAGKIDTDEEPEVCAARELREETGYEAGKVTKIFEFYSSPGFSNEKIYLYKAENLTLKSMDLDEDEFIEIAYANKESVKKMIETNRIIDGKTLVAILYWLNS